jgi:hypothetical protein
MFRLWSLVSDYGNSVIAAGAYKHSFDNTAAAALLHDALQ